MILASLFDRLKGKKVRMFAKPFGSGTSNKFEGTVIQCLVSTFGEFIELDNGKLINVHYIANIEILED